MKWNLFVLLIIVYFIGACSMREVDNIHSIKAIVQETYNSNCDVLNKRDTFFLIIRFDSSIINNKTKHKLVNSLLIYKSFKFLPENRFLVFVYQLQDRQTLTHSYLYTANDITGVYNSYRINNAAPLFAEYITTKLTNKELFYYDRAIEGLMLYRRDTTYQYDFIETTLRYCDEIYERKGKNSKYLSIIKSIKIIMEDNEIVPKDVDVGKLDYFISYESK